MQIIPLCELKNTSRIEKLCTEENGPVFVTKNGYGCLVVMKLDYYQQAMQGGQMQGAKEGVMVM